MKVPVMSNDPNTYCPGGCIKRYLFKLSPGQLRVYCKLIPLKYRKRCDNKFFYAEQPCGKEKINEMFKRGAKIMGMCDFSDFKPHTLRKLLNNQLNNDPNVSLKECMAAMRQTTPSINVVYQERNQKSEENRFIAMGIKLPPQHQESRTEVARLTKKRDCDEISHGEWKEAMDHDSQSEWIDFQHNSPAKKTPFKTPNTKPISNIVSNLKSELLPTQMTVFTQSEQFTPKESYSSFLNNQPTTQMAIDCVKKDIEALAAETNFVHEEKKSAERQQILHLGQYVRDLRKEVISLREKVNYYESYKRCPSSVQYPTNQYINRPPSVQRPTNPYINCPPSVQRPTNPYINRTKIEKCVNPYSKMQHGCMS